MLSATPSGFVRAPVSRALVLATVFLPMVVSMLGVQYRFALAWRPQLVEWHQAGRVLLNAGLFTDQVSVIVAAVALYETRAVERLLGPRRFAAAAAQVAAGAALALPAVLWALDAVGVALSPPAGPISLVAGLLTLYHELVPPVFTFHVRGAGTVSDRALLYAVAAQLLLSSPGAALKAALGWFFARLVFALRIA